MKTGRQARRSRRRWRQGGWRGETGRLPEDDDLAAIACFRMALDSVRLMFVSTEKKP
jgi:hypothetical protein